MTGPTDSTVVVTGGAGFIGSHLAEALVEENEVRVLDDFSGGDWDNVPEEATVVRGDVRDPAVVQRAVDGADIVFHEAALVSVEESVEHPARAHRVNADATLHVLEAARRADARVVLASSAAVYGHPESVPVAESDPKRPTSPYGIDKLAVDHYARRYHDLYGLETVALRYFNVYGPRQSSDYSAVVSVFLDQATADNPITVEGDGSQTRDFVHVSDVVAANLRAATTDHVGEAFNVATGTSTSIRELAETVRRATGARSEVVHTDPRPGDIQHSRADISKATRLLGYEPSTSLEAGLRALADERA